MTTYISETQGQFTYFDHRLGSPDWTGKRVLDFGGNIGNLLRDPNCRIEPKNYWCIDLSRDAIAEGQQRYPEAHFIFYDRYNYEYNPTGVGGLPIPDPGLKFDFILAFEVISHNSKAETLRLVDQLVAMLTEDGRLAFTFIDPLWAPPPEWVRKNPPASAFRTSHSILYRMLEEQHGGKLEMDFGDMLGRVKENNFKAESEGWSNLRWRLRHVPVMIPGTDVDALLAQAENASLTWAAVVDGDKLVVDPDEAGLPEEDPENPKDLRLYGYLNFCTAEYMSRLFPNVQIHPPDSGERLHCAIIEARKGRQ